jgi:hypothetical protein
MLSAKYELTDNRPSVYHSFLRVVRLEREDAQNKLMVDLRPYHQGYYKSGLGIFLNKEEVDGIVKELMTNGKVRFEYTFGCRISKGWVTRSMFDR